MADAADWWTRFQDVDGHDREAMIDALHSAAPAGDQRPRKRRRRRRRKPPEG